MVKINRSLFENNPEFFLNLVCLNYPLPEWLIDKYIHYWKWELLSTNENLNFTKNQVLKYQNYWVYYDNAKTFPIGLSSNIEVPWDAELLNKLEKKLDWEQIAINQAVPWNEKLIEMFKNHLNEKSINHLYKEIILENQCTDIQDYNDEIEDDPIYELDFTTKYQLSIGDKEIISSIDWEKLSDCENFNWTEKIIDYYYDYWDWYNLTFNRALPWSLDFIKKYESKWFWGSAMKDEKGDIHLDGGLCINPAISWTFDLIDEYKDKIIWPHFFFNPSIKWNVEFVERYFGYLPETHSFFGFLYEIYEPFLNNTIIDNVMETIFKQVIISN